jgi:hypothetical protein
MLEFLAIPIKVIEDFSHIVLSFLIRRDISIFFNDFNSGVVSSEG